jgi:hypothetical protein
MAEQTSKKRKQASDATPVMKNNNTDHHEVGSDTPSLQHTVITVTPRVIQRDGTSIIIMKEDGPGKMLEIVPVQGIRGVAKIPGEQNACNVRVCWNPHGTADMISVLRVNAPMSTVMAEVTAALRAPMTPSHMTTTPVSGSTHVTSGSFLMNLPNPFYA